MSVPEPRTLALNLLLLLLGGLVAVALTGPLFPLIYSQQHFPRALVQNSGTLQSTFYADTFDRREPMPYTAILGDSYGQGMGDAYLSGRHDYSVAHRLHAADGRNYLIFARSGYGSINSARELLRTLGWSRLSPFVPSLGEPARMLFFFYEGNDLNNNLDHLEDRGWSEYDREQLRPAILREVADGASLPWGDRVDAWLPFYTLTSNSGRVFEDLIHDPLLGNRDTAAEPFPSAAGLREQLEFISRHEKLQSAAAELDEGRLRKGVDVFLLTLEALQTLVPRVPITVVYIPSPVSCYHWDEPVPIETYHPRGQALRIPMQQNEHNHRLIKAQLAAGVERLGIDLIDATPALRTAARTRLLHGPRDVKHLNAEGYRLLAGVIQEARHAGND